MVSYDRLIWFRLETRNPAKGNHFAGVREERSEKKEMKRRKREWMGGEREKRDRTEREREEKKKSLGSPAGNFKRVFGSYFFRFPFFFSKTILVFPKHLPLAQDEVGGPWTVGADTPRTARVIRNYYSQILFHANHGFDVRQHLCTVTRYDASKGLANNGLAPSNIPDGCTPLHLNLVARHGTRSPTKKRMEELDRLASHLEVLVNDAKQEAESGNLSLEKIPAWLHGWQSPWKGKQNGGDLISEGKNELYHLGIRVRERFKDLFNQDYHPDVYTIKSTQVPRVLASAEAFSMGLFGENRNLGPLHLASSGTTEGHKSDILLRFFDHCETYKQYKKKKEPALAKLKEPTLDKITSSFVSRYHLNFTRQDVASLWFLCKQEASLMDITDQACGLFTPSEVSLMEWTDDLEVFLLKGYGNTINYRMGVTLLKDVLESMDQAIRTKEGTSEKARLRFAHAETVVPFSCMLGLFLEGDDLEKLNREQPLELPPKPPQKRNWRGTLMTPFAGNNMLVLYNCPANNESKYYVQVLHNEVPVPLPGCSNSSFCPFDTFKEKVAKPHLVHNYNTLCDAKLEVEPVLGTSKSAL